MERVRLGTQSISISRLMYGTLTLGPLQRNLPLERGAALLCYAAKKGVNFVDTAEMYGTYPYIRLALAQHSDLAICTKSYAYDLDGAKRSVEAAQEGIGREHIDVFLLHEQESRHTLRGHAQALGYYLQLREEGIIGAVGISTHHIAAVEAATDWPGIDVVFPMINREGLGIADGTRAQMENAIERAHHAGLGVLAMKALGGGHLLRSRQEALCYARDLAGISAVAVGMQSEAEIDYNIALFEGREPDAQSAEVSMRAPRTLIVQDWCEGCGRCVMRCGLGALSIQEGKAVVDTLRCVRCGYCAAVCPQFCLKVI